MSDDDIERVVLTSDQAIRRHMARSHGVAMDVAYRLAQPPILCTYEQAACSISYPAPCWRTPTSPDASATPSRTP